MGLTGTAYTTPKREKGKRKEEEEEENPTDN